jgi:hypothetical protein
MAQPTNKTEFKTWCLRKLGSPVIEINVSDEQVDDRVTEGLKFFSDFHFDGVDKTYFKYQITQNNFPTSIFSLTLDSGGNSYTNSDTLTFSGGDGTANGSITTNANGSITAVTLSNNGLYFLMTPNVSITSANGTGGSITAELGGFIPIPDNIIGVVNLFDVGIAASASNLFNLKYQIVLNDLYLMYNNIQVVPYAMAMYNVAMIEEILVGKQPIRYNRLKNKLYIDMDWSIVIKDLFLLIEAYQVLDPVKYTDIWSDQWLQRYCTVLIKENWGSNLKKFGNMAMPGGIVFNGQQIYDEAVNDREKLEYELINTYSLPAAGIVG